VFMRRIGLFGVGAITLFGVAGCPLTDNYFIEVDQAPAGGTGGMSAGGAQAGGAISAGAGGAGAACVPRTERCNGHDDDCNGSVDELACAAGCTGFVLSLDSTHGYMFCTGRRTWVQARDTCAAQGMLLARVESSAENRELARALAALSTDNEVTFGANDQAVEGDWVWDGGTQFWEGGQTGTATGGSFVIWASGSPDNSNNEDCGIINPSAATWADRSCAGTHVYVCEDAVP
jgi:hypothetical protein